MNKTNFRLSCLGTLMLFSSLGITIPLLSQLAEDLGHSQAAIGVLNGAFWLVLVFARVPLGGALTAASGRPWLAVGLAATAIAYFLLVHTTNLYLMLGLRLVQGVSFAAASIALLAFAMPVSDAKERAALFSVYSIFCFLGYALGPAVGEYLAHHFSFRVAFSCSAVLAAGAIVPALFLRPSLPGTAAGGPSPGPEPAGARRGLGLGLSHVHLLLVAAPLGMSEAFVPLFSRQNGYGHVGSFFFTFAVAMLCARLNMARLTARFDHAPIAAAGTAFCMLSLGVLTAASSAFMLIASAALMGLGWGLFFPALMAVATRRAEGSSVKDVALLESVYDLSFFLGQFGFGLLISGVGYRMSFAASALLCLACLLTLHRSGSARPMARLVAPDVAAPREQRAEP